MNQLLTNYNGGFPFQLDDLRFLDSAQREAFLGIIKAMVGSTTSAILAGCEVTNDGTTIHVNEGYVFLGNEIFYSPAQDLPVLDTGDYFWETNISYDAAGDKSFDGTTQHTYQIRQAHCVFKAAGTEGTLPPMLMDNILTILKTRLGVTDPAIETGWTEVALEDSNVIAPTGTISNINGKMAYKLRGKTAFVSIQLTFSVTTDAPSIYIYLPVAFSIKMSTVLKTNLIHNIEASYDSARDDYIYRLMAWNTGDYLMINHLDNNTKLIANNYQMIGQIFFEIN